MPSSAGRCVAIPIPCPRKPATGFVCKPTQPGLPAHVGLATAQAVNLRKLAERVITSRGFMRQSNRFLAWVNHHGIDQLWAIITVTVKTIATVSTVHRDCAKRYACRHKLLVPRSYSSLRHFDLLQTGTKTSRPASSKEMREHLLADTLVLRRSAKPYYLRVKRHGVGNPASQDRR